MAAASDLIEEPAAETCRTRPRPTPHSDAEAFQMEAIHAEFLDNYHREAHQDNEEGDDDQQVSISVSKSNTESVTLSETPLTVTEELNASLNEGLPQANMERKKPITRNENLNRQLSETVRFFQAVGESPPNFQGDIQTIIEDDNNSDSDSEDDAGTVHRVADSGESENFDLSFDFHLMEREEDSPRSTPLKALHKPKPARKTAGHPKSPFKKQGIFHRLPSGNELNTDGFQYKGIQNPPEITQRGVSRGNYALLHRKAWLEVTDERHRYGKNLRLYYRKWSSLGYPSNDFFDWLDSKGSCKDQPLPELAECPRSELDSDTVLYIQDSEITKQYALTLHCDESGHVHVFDSDDEPVCTGPEGWIFVLRDNVLYGAEKVTSVSDHARQRFHHSSFFGGKAVAAAGIFITDTEGILIRVLPHSGHYRPKEPDMQRMLFFLCNAGADLRLIEVDTQQLNHIDRKDPTTFKKKAKKDSLHLSSAALVAHFLSHKARFIGQGIFSQVHQIRLTHQGSVEAALREVDPATGGLLDID